jgi:hypothetical protein
MDIRYTRSLDNENIAMDGVVDEYKSKIARCFSALFVSKFFTNTSKRREETKNNIIIIIGAIVVAFSVGLAAFFVKGNNPAAGFYSALIALSLAYPATFILQHKLPYHHLQKVLCDRGSALIGEEACYEASDVDVIAFEDTDIFGPDDVVFKSVTLSDRSGDFRKVMRKMSSLFAAVGGPLDKVFANSLGSKCSPASSVIVENDGICGTVDGAVVMAGNRGYMERKGVKVPPEDQNGIESTKVMYGAAKDMVFAKFSIQYSFSEEFALLVGSLIEKGIKPLVYTRDPNVTEDLINFLAGNKSNARILKKSGAKSENVVYKSLCASFVTIGEKTDAVCDLMIAKNYKQLMLSLSVVQLLLSLSGLLVGCAAFFFGGSSVVISGLVLGWHGVLGIAHHLFIKRFLKGKGK